MKKTAAKAPAPAQAPQVAADAVQAPGATAPQAGAASAQLLERLQKAKTRDVAEKAVAEGWAAGLPADQQAELQQLFYERFPQGLQTAPDFVTVDSSPPPKGNP